MKMERQLAHPLPTSPFRSDVLNGRVVLITGCVHMCRCASSRVLITCGYVSVVLILILLFSFLSIFLVLPVVRPVLGTVVPKRLESMVLK